MTIQNTVRKCKTYTVLLFQPVNLAFKTEQLVAFQTVQRFNSDTRCFRLVQFLTQFLLCTRRFWSLLLSNTTTTTYYYYDYC